MSKRTPNQLQQLILGATEGLPPFLARRLHKTITAAYWLGVDDGRKFERSWPETDKHARITTADPAKIVSSPED